jgi:tetratricopeptide (TPR) repeat protein
MKKLFAFVILYFSGLLQAQNAFSTPFNEAVECLQRADYKGGIDHFSSAIKNKKEAANNYKIADAYIYRGFCKLQLLNYKEALADVNTALALKPEYLKCHAMMARIFLQQKKYDECIARCDTALKIMPSNDEIILIKADAQRGLKKYDDALTSLRRMLENNPRNTDVLKGLGATFIKKKTWDSAAYYFNSALEINPTDVASYFDRGISKSYLLDFKSAQEDIEHGMKLDTTMNYVGYNNLGFFLKLEQKEYAAAVEYFSKAIALKPDFAYAYSNRGFAKLNLGDTQGAFKDLRRSLELDNTNSYAYKNLGLIYLKVNDNKKACENFQKAERLFYFDSYDDEVNNLLKENNCR